MLLQINYTAREGSALLLDAVTAHLRVGINAMASGAHTPGLHQIISARHEFPTELHRFLHPFAETGPQELTLHLASNRFPYMFRGWTIEVVQVHVFVRLTDASGMPAPPASSSR